LGKILKRKICANMRRKNIVVFLTFINFNSLRGGNKEKKRKKNAWVNRSSTDTENRKIDLTNLRGSWVRSKKRKAGKGPFAIKA